MKSFDFKELLPSKSILTVKTTKSCMFSCVLYVPDNVLTVTFCKFYMEARPSYHTYLS